MNILLIGFTDKGGGAAAGIVHLYRALADAGINADLYVHDKRSNEHHVHLLPRKKTGILQKITCRLINAIMKHFFRTSNGIYHSVNLFSDTDIEWINKSNYDVVHLHWINGAIGIADIAKIQKPIVWTMHDSWPCCGAEHHPNCMEKDNRWKEGYTKAGKPDSTKGLDICRYVWMVKNKLWKDKYISFIAPSEWEHNVIVESALFRNGYCRVIPNVLPCNIFYERADAKARLNIPHDKKILGFGAAYGINNPESMKGTFYLVKALHEIPDANDYFIIIFGPATKEFTDKIPIPFISTGFIEDMDDMAEIYSCCDCFINCSLLENFSYTIYEALACGTPVVAFDAGGNSDLISHKVNGYLAEPYCSYDLAKGIGYCMTQKGIRERCRQIRTKYDKASIVKEHLHVYQDAMDNDEY